MDENSSRMDMLINDTSRVNQSYLNRSDYTLYDYGFYPPGLQPAPEMLVQIVKGMDEYGVPVTVGLGTVLNILIIFTVLHTDLKKVSVCLYFASLGIVDTIYLFAMIIPWASTRVINIYSTEGFCQLVYYSNLLTTFLSNWYMALLMWERSMTLFQPESARKFCNPFRTKCTLIVLSIFSVVAHLYLTWTSGVINHGPMRVCNIIPKNYQDIEVMRRVDVVFSFIIPVSLVFILSIVVFAKLHHFCCACSKDFMPVATNAKVSLFSVQPKRVSNEIKNVNNCLRSFSESTRVSFVCLLLSVLFLVFSMPYSIDKLLLLYTTRMPTQPSPEKMFRQMLFERLFYINFAYRGLVCFVLLPDVRQAFWNLISNCFKMSRKKQKADNNDDNEV